MDIDKQKWPDKFDINMLVTIPEDIQKIIRGDKTAVRRNDRYADPGDRFELNGHTVVVENVYPQKLRDISDADAREEGYKSLEEYKQGITSIHGEEVWDSDLVIWAHIMHPVQKG
ncbi:fructose-1-phosphate kinase [Lentibacillus amyloliquefaciens]|uniref:Fructose-1-phosphate kinase n=1 Tax=Lentibacillus amyloliquefaciens TaxID=1472767 RepID=A0A0U4FF01_9BACI|nr:fructose-1-phosphate kinase [Lentibacillus amyloliquefaciens]ALX47262.1 fructose-1-phosphate kinase [Lentibacillus amyloliquefaciens]